MILTRKLLAIVAGMCVGYGLVALFTISTTDFGVAMAIAAGCWLGVEVTYVVERERAAMREYRDEVWERRDSEVGR